jgi:plastocyanin
MSRTVQWIIGIIIVAAIAVGIGVAMNNNNDNNQTTTTPPPATSQNNNSTSNNPSQSESKKSNDVTIENMAFTPASLTVKKGLTITWTNKDSLAHTVTSDSGSELSSGTIAPGSTYSHNFSTVGTYKYHCSIHPNMTGTITVTE